VEALPDAGSIPAASTITLFEKMNRKRRKRVPDTRSETDTGLLAAYLSDPIALWQDGEHEALEALYAQPDGMYANRHVEPRRSEAGTAEGKDDSLPF